MIHNITFSIPDCKIVDSVPSKTKILATVIPARTETYIFNEEVDYFNDYKTSMFAITTKKSGWDCMRHYEIMACGCIPYFPNIENCPKNTMTLLPKDLFIECNALYAKYKDYKISDFTSDEFGECSEMITKLIDHTKTYLTTYKMAKYILKKSQSHNVSSVLYLSGRTDPDYLRCVTLHGFKQLLGNKCHDYPKVPHIYKSSTINYKSLYGKGMTYSNLLDENLHDNESDKTVEQDIKNKKYDVVIYGSYHRGIPLYNLVCEYYKPSEMLMLCGEDLHPCNYNELISKGHTVFVREL
jgi:hypothetical protein